MTLPGWRAWVFSGKAFAAACLALYLALWIDLPRPYWAVTTVYVVSHPFAGPTLSKAVYRLLGTALGGVGAVLLVPNLVTSPELLTLGLSLWTGICLMLSLLDRRPHSYIFMLAGYTAPIIGFPAVDDPGGIFLTAIARVQEIGLGIVCASLVGMIVLPQSVGQAFTGRVDAWLRDAALLLRDAVRDPQKRTQGPEPGLRPSPAPAVTAAGLATAAIEIDLLATHLGFDPASPRQARRWAEMLRSRMLLLLPLASSVGNRLAALPAGQRPAFVHDAVQAVRNWLDEGAPAAGAASARAVIDQARDAAERPAVPDWPGILTANLLLRLRELVDLQLDCQTLARHILGQAGRPVLAAPGIEGARGARARHADIGLALRSAVAAVLAMLLGSWFWIATAWPEGSSLPVMAAVVCSFFSSLDSPVRPQLAFAWWSLVAVLVSAGYVFALLPLAHDYETVVLLLAPVLLGAGLVAANPATSLIGLALCANIPTLIGLQGRYTGDFPSFANGGLALVGGLCLGAAVTALARVIQPHWVAQRILRASWLSLARAAEQRGQGNRAAFTSLLLDRVGQLAPRQRLKEAGRQSAGQAGPDMMASIRIGLNIVDLRRARHHLPPALARLLDQVLDGMATEFRARARGQDRPQALALLRSLDATLAGAVALPPGTVRDDLLMGLAGLRLSLFSTEAAPAPFAAVAALPRPMVAA
jgi:uncharacterized membrane protein YccC